MRVNLVQESARHLQMTRARQMRVDTRDLAEAFKSAVEVVVQNGRGTTQLKATQSSLTNHQNFN